MTKMTKGNTPAEKPRVEQKPVRKMTSTELVIAFGKECLRWEDADVDSDSDIYTYSKNGAYIAFDPRSLASVMQAVREWLSEMDAYETEETFEDIFNFSFGSYFVGELDQAEVCGYLISACVEACRREK
jgi:hypothetical protein